MDCTENEVSNNSIVAGVFIAMVVSCCLATTKGIHMQTNRPTDSNVMSYVYFYFISKQGN